MLKPALTTGEKAALNYHGDIEGFGDRFDTVEGALRNIANFQRSIQTDFMGGIVTSKKLGGAATGAGGDEDLMIVGGYGYGNKPAVCLEWSPKGTQTILAPKTAATGLDVNMDQTEDDGIEITAGILYRAGAPHSFKVGTDGAFYFKATFSIANVSGTDDCAIGFRKAEAYQANIDDYDELACLNVISGDIKIETILNGAATTTTDTTDNWADTETHTLCVKVSATGVVTYEIDDAAPTTVAAFSFDSGEEVVPFFFFLNAAAPVAGAVVFSLFECGLQNAA